MAALVAPLDDERRDSFVFAVGSGHEIRVKSSVNTKTEDVTGVSESLPGLHRSDPGDVYRGSESTGTPVGDAEDRLFVSGCSPDAERQPGDGGGGGVSPAGVITEDTWLSQDQ